MWLSDYAADTLRTLLERVERFVEYTEPYEKQFNRATQDQRQLIAKDLEGFKRWADLSKVAQPSDVQDLRSILGELDEMLDALWQDDQSEASYHSNPTWASDRAQKAHDKLKGLLAGLDYVATQRRE